MGLCGSQSLLVFLVLFLNSFESVCVMRLREPASIKTLDLGKKKVHGDPGSILVFLHGVGRESGKAEK